VRGPVERGLGCEKRSTGCENYRMAPILARFYRRFGRSYPYVFLTVELQSAYVITAATLGLFSFYYNGSTSEYASNPGTPTGQQRSRARNGTLPAITSSFAFFIEGLSQS